MNRMTNIAIIEDLTLVPVPQWWQNPWAWVAITTALVVIGYFVRRWWRSRPAPVPAVLAPPPGPPPHLEALRRMTDLRARHASLGPYEVALECSDILRRYIEGRFALPIRFQTTREFLGAAQSEPLLGPEPRLELGEFLNFFDRLKFARDTATSSETLAAIDGAERFIRRCIPEEKTPNDKT